jgi:hypothetical protein
MKSYRLWYSSGHIVWNLYQIYTVEDAWSSKQQCKDCEWPSQFIVCWQLCLFNRRCMEANVMKCGSLRLQKACDITAEPPCYFLLLLHKEWCVAFIFAMCMQSILCWSAVSERPRTHTRQGDGRHSCKQFNSTESNNAVQRRQPNHLEAFKAILNTQLTGRDRWVGMAAKLTDTTVIRQPKTRIWGDVDKSH